MKIIGMGGAVVAAIGSLGDYIVPGFNAGLATLGMAGLGVYLSTASGPPEKDRKKLYITAAANFFMSVVAVTLVPHLFGWEWAGSRAEAPLAGAFAYLSKYWLPAVIEAIPDLLRKFTKLKEYKDEETPKQD